MKEKHEHTAKSMTLATLKYMNYGGCSPINRTSAKLCFAMACVIISGITAFLMALNLLLNKHDTAGKFVEDTVMFFAFVQIVVKYYVCIFKSSLLYNMLHMIWTEFWPLDILADKERKEKMQSLYRTLAIIVRIYMYIVTLVVLAMVIQATLNENRSLMADIWTPFAQTMKQSPYYEMMHGFQVILFSTSVCCCVIQIDSLFIIMIGLAYVQFRMVKCKLLRINKFNSDNSKLISECVSHHDMLLRFLSRFEMLYSQLLLVSVGSSMLISTMAMYALVMEDTISRRLTFLMMTMAVFLQIFSHCFAGQLIQDEGVTVGQVAYECDWSDIENRDVRMGLIMIIIRSQKKINITCGGFMILCMESFTKVARASLSFLTFIVNIRT